MPSRAKLGKTPSAGLFVPGLSVMVSVACAVGLPGCDQAGNAAVAGSARAIPTVTGPMSLFQRSCASCHGAYGELFDPLRREWTDQERRDMVVQMIRTRTTETVGDAQIDALTAYVRSIRESRAFVALTRREGDTLAGEVTPGAKVTVSIDGRAIAAVVEEHRWSCHAESGAVIASVDAVGTDGARALLRAGAEAFAIGPRKR